MRRPAPAELGIELERARDHDRRQRAAAAVADDHDLVGRAGARRGDQALRAGFDRPIEAGRLAAGEFAQIRPVAVDLDHEPALPRAAAAARKTASADTMPMSQPREAAAGRHTPSPRGRSASRTPRRARSSRAASAWKYISTEPELPGGAQHAHERAADEIVERPAERARNLPRHRLGHVGADEVLLPEELVAGRRPASSAPPPRCPNARTPPTRFPAARACVSSGQIARKRFHDRANMP